MKKLYIAVVSGLIVLLSMLVFLFWMNRYLDSHVVWNTTLEGKDISGMSRAELRSHLSAQKDNLDNMKVSLEMNGVIKQSTWSELGVNHDPVNLDEKIFSEQGGSLTERVMLSLDRWREPKNLPFPSFFDESRFEKTFDELFPNIVTKPVNAEIGIENNQIVVKGGQVGQVVDEELLKATILKGRLQGRVAIPVPMKEVAPAITKESVQAMGIREIVSSYTTTFSEDSEGRTTNLKLSSDAIDGIILKPGDVFDFNKVVGETTYARGYVDAAVFSGGKVVDGVGGGICQVSSTLYNAAVSHDMKIVERHNHGLPVSYVPLGRDATVAWGYLNFRFKNDSKHHVYIQSKVSGGRLTVTLFGTKNERDVYLESEDVAQVTPPVRRVPDDTLPEGQTLVESEGVYGYRTKTWKVTREEGKMTERELVSEDYYKPIATVVRVGTRR